MALSNLAAMVAAGLLSPQQAATAQAALNSLLPDSGDQRLLEDALRTLEGRINAKAAAYFADMAQRISQHPDVALDVAREAQLLREALLPDLTLTAQLGGQAGLITAAQSGAPVVGFVWGQVNLQAAAWAAEYVGHLIQQITATTLNQVQAAVAAFHSTPGMTRATLERLILAGPEGITDLLAKTGRIIPASQRAEMIAVTEVTRSYSAGEVAGLRASGLPMTEPLQQPPAHVFCRCGLAPFPRQDGIMSWQWQTLNDELVCPICRPLHGQDVGAGRDWGAPQRAETHA